MTTQRLKELPTWLLYFVVSMAYAWGIAWVVAGLPLAMLLGVLNTIGKAPLHMLGLPVPGEPTVEQVGGRRAISPWSYVPWCTN